ncbi:MAG: hypothetical protein H6720_26395 [Sandaracinus sp.]|nr:hypothetical protein [Sandaracinus sp.]
MRRLHAVRFTSLTLGLVLGCTGNASRIDVTDAARETNDAALPPLPPRDDAGVPPSPADDAGTMAEDAARPTPNDRFDCTATGTPGTYAVAVDHPGGPATVASFLEGATPSLVPIVSTFVAVHPGDYDFVYLLTEAPVSAGAAVGRFYPVHHEDLPEIGLPGVATHPEYASLPSLRGVVALQLGATQTNGPTLHESLHAWGVFLDPSLRFGRDEETSFFSHWGVSGVNGQLGGFDPATLRCTAPSSTATDTCTEARVAGFGPTANGGDTVPYAPFELYLMGLLPAAQVPSVPLLEGARFVSYDEPSDEIVFSLSGGITQRSAQDVVRTMGGERPPMGDRVLRGAMVLVTDGAPSASALARAQSWARVLGNVDASPYLLSFCEATGGRARMDTAIGP